VTSLPSTLPPKSIRGDPDRYETPPGLTDLRLENFADSFLRDVDTAGFDRFVLVGHSMGGLTISEVARREPDRVEHLVYVSCIVPREGESAMQALPPTLLDTPPDLVEMFCSNMTTGFATCRDAPKRRLTCAYGVG
jgi:pimeloyl-ACP methyl ester carboxylesterase